MMRPRPQRSLAGMTLLEVVVSAAIIAVILAAVSQTMARSARTLQNATDQSYAESRVHVALDRIEQELEYAVVHVPNTRLASTLGAGNAAQAELLDATGFPNGGALLLYPGQPNEELIAYDGLSLGPDRILDLTRGARCTDPATHELDSLVLWAGCATALDDQAAPAANLWDGMALDNGRDVFYRGEGSGVVFRRPVDPAGNGNYLDQLGNVQWGANVAGSDTTSGWSCLYYLPEGTAVEATLGADLNNDGDQADTFDLGRIRMRSWDASDPDGELTDIGLTPPIVMQEDCAWGADLDADGREDPIFLWDPIVSRLRVRLFFLHTAPDAAPVVRDTDTAYFIRNGSLE
ncbi:MAG: hypothetical protein AAFZ65_13330 [Planctomycetota bacterium]